MKTIISESCKEISVRNPEVPHFTGRGRDLRQFKALSSFLKGEKTILFVGCSTGEEMLDFQEINSSLQFFGVDYDKSTVDLANKQSYKASTKIFIADILKDSFISDLQKQTSLSSFDIVVCRNLLIYYNHATAQQIAEKLAELTGSILLLGTSDPFCFPFKDTKTKIGSSSFEILDLENRIFRKE